MQSVTTVAIRTARQKIQPLHAVTERVTSQLELLSCFVHVVVVLLKRIRYDAPLKLIHSILKRLARLKLGITFFIPSFMEARFN